jgi:hypothetical protein
LRLSPNCGAGLPSVGHINLDRAIFKGIGLKHLQAFCMPSWFPSQRQNPLLPEFVTDERYRLDFPCLGKKSVNFFFGCVEGQITDIQFCFHFFLFFFKKTPPIHLIWWFSPTIKIEIYTQSISFRKVKNECAAPILSGAFCPDLSAMRFNQGFGNCQTNTAAAAVYS